MMLDNIALLQTVVLVPDFANKLRPASDPIRGSQQAFLDFGAAHAIQTIFTLPVGATRCRIIAFEINNPNVDAGLLMYDNATLVFSTLDIAANTNFNRSASQLGGGIIIATSLRVDPASNNCTFWCSYIVEYDSTDA